MTDIQEMTAPIIEMENCDLQYRVREKKEDRQGQQ